MPSLLHRSVILFHNIWVWGFVSVKPLYNCGGSEANLLWIPSLAAPTPLSEKPFTFCFPVRCSSNTDIPFPPPPLSQRRIDQVISGWCTDSSPHLFQEAGCGVCGQLTPVTQL
ncbi:hypothetical protein BT96DRAFT_839122, partial [Gymnopus androsaceus JB14]